MKGENRMNLSQETMCLIVQYWLNAKFTCTPAPLVNFVHAEKGNRFEVVLVESKKAS